MKSRYFSFVWIVTALLSGTALAQPEPLAHSPVPGRTAPPTDTKGPLPTATAEYRLPASIDPEILADNATEIWARVYRPKELGNSASGATKKLPLLMFLHGNHGTCGSGTNPRHDNSCEYTSEGTCPPGMVVTPNHEGYNYVAENLASWGYVVVSINANRGITCGSGNGDDWGLILARGRLVLKHLQLWNEWSRTGGAPATLGSPDLFLNAIDLSNVGLMGHSRGGEGVRAALNLYRDPGNTWAARIPGLDIRAIYEIGAVDGQSNRVLDAPSVAWNQLLPLCDGDVSDLQGRMPYERMMARFSAKAEGETRPSPKSLTMVWGANHNYFNTEWQTSDAYGCSGAPTHKPLYDDSLSESKEQQSVALQSMTAFFRTHVGSDRVTNFAQTFDPAFAFPSVFTSVAVADRDFTPALELAKSFRVDDFTAATGINPAGPANTTSVVAVSHSSRSEPPVANISWKQTGADRFYQTNFAAEGSGQDLAAFDFVDFRVGRVLQDPEKELAKPVDFSVALVRSERQADGSWKDVLSPSVAIASYSRLVGPPNDSAELTQTVRIPKTAFAPWDLSKVRGVRFVFDKTDESNIRLAHVRFGVAFDKITVKSANTFAEILSINKAAAILNGQKLNEQDAKPAETTPADEIIPPNESHLASPFALPLPSVRSRDSVQRGSWMLPRKVKKSKQLSGRSAVEITIGAENGFPVLNSLAVLNIENRLFKISRFPSGRTHAMTFTIPAEIFERLPESGRAQIQYGLKKPTRVWTLPPFSKEELRGKMLND